MQSTPAGSRRRKPHNSGRQDLPGFDSRAAFYFLAPREKGRKKKMKTYKDQGRIVKPFRYKSLNLASSLTGHYNEKGYGAIVINNYDNTIDVDMLSGPAPFVKDIILFLLSDRHIRVRIKEYQQSQKRDRRYALLVSTWLSGRQDIYINYYNGLGLQTGGKKLLHKSCLDKLNEGWIKMKVGDFVELVAFLMKQSGADYDLKDARRIRKLSGCHYVRGYFCENTTQTASKII